MNQFVMDDCLYQAETHIEAQLRTIQSSAGFNTDAGSYVDWGRIAFDSSEEFPRLTYHVLDGVTDDEGTGKPVSEFCKLIVEAHIQFKENPALIVDHLRRDVVNAMKCIDSPHIGRIKFESWSRIDRQLGSKFLSLELEFEFILRRGCLNAYGR